MKISVLVPIATLCCGVFAGYIAGKNVSMGDSSSSTLQGSKSAERRAISVQASSEAGSKTVYRSSEAILNSPGQTARTERLMRFYENLDPARFAEEAQKLEDLPWSERLISSYLLFSRWGEEAPREALAYADTMGQGGRFVKPTILQSWAGEDPEGAAGYYEENKAEFANRGWRGGGRNTSQAIAKEWARSDSAAALAWSKGLEGRDAERSVAGVFQQVALDDPAKAAEMLAAEGDVSGRNDALESIGLSWGKSDPETAEVWANSMSGDDRDEAMRAVIRGLASTDVESAAGKALALSAGEAQDSAVADVAGQMARDRPEDALSWLMANGSTEAQSDGVGNVISSLARQNDSAAQAFISDQSSGPVKDSAAAYYVYSNRNSDGAAVVDIALTIEDNSRRERSLRRATRQWLRTDEAAATEFIETSDQISDELRDRLLN